MDKLVYTTRLMVFLEGYRRELDTVLHIPPERECFSEGERELLENQLKQVRRMINDISFVIG